MSHMSKHFHQNTSITVAITCNQIIERSDTYMYPYMFASSFPLSIRLIGHNNASISVKDMAYLTIDQESESEFNLAWIGFTIFTRIRGIIWHVNMNSLVIHNCKIMTTQLKITNSRNVFIDSTEFRGTFGRNSFCPSITVSHSTSFTFSNNNFSTCKFPNFVTLVSFDITEDYTNLTIINCTFMEIIGYHLTNEINKNQDARILSVNMEETVTSVLTLNESHFIGNSNVKLLTVHALPEKADYEVSAILHGLVILNNTCTSALVEINRNTIDLIGGLDVTLSNLLVDVNNVGSTTNWSQAVGGLESSVFSFSKVIHVLVTNSNFTNNHGTPLNLKADEWTTDFFFCRKQYIFKQYWSVWRSLEH